jgi:hypothetical protein
MTAAEEHDQHAESGAEAHSCGDQLDNVNRVKRFEAGLAGDAVKAYESHAHQNENGRHHLTSIPH